MKSPGKLVCYTTKDNTVQKGRTYNSDNLINGKVVVHLLTDDHKHIEENGQPKKVLVDGKKLTIKGYID
jgi:hypothetical protein